MADMKLNLNLQAKVADANASFGKLANSTAKATGNFKAHQKALHETSAKMTNLNKDANRTSDTILKLGGNFSKLGNVLKGGAIAGSIMVIGRAFASFAAKHTTSAMNAVETNNLFEVSFGEMAGEVEDSLYRISEATGLNLTNLKNVSGTYSLLARSMGFNSEQASTLATNMTNLGMDLSSLMNVPIDQVMGDLRSGLLGQSETVYKYGIDVTEAAIAQEALNLGISKSVREMSQGEKMYLRQSVIMQHTALAHGDMAKTINESANQLKMLQMRFQTLSETIGKLFLPVLEWILPYANAVVIVLTRLAQAIGRFFGIDMSPKMVDNTRLLRDGFNSVKPSTSSLSSDLDKVGKNLDKVGNKSKKNTKKTKKDLQDTGKEVKKLNNILLGIDEINILGKQPEDNKDNKTDPSSGLGDIPDLGKVAGDIGKIGAGLGDIGDGLGGVFGGLPIDAFNNGLDNIKDKAQEIADKFIKWAKNLKELAEKWLPRILILATLVGLAFLSWKISGLIGTGSTALKALAGLFDTIALKAMYAGDGIKGFFTSARFKNASGIFLILSGLILLFLGLKDVLSEAKPPLEAFLKVFAGFALIAGGIFLLGFGGIPALIALAVGAIVTLGLAIWKYWDEISAWIANAWAGFKEILGNLGAWISDAWESIKTSTAEKWESIKQYLSETWDSIKNKVSELWEHIKTWTSETWDGIKQYLSDTWDSLKTKVGEIWGAIGQFLADTWDWVKQKTEDAWNAIKTFITETIPKIIGDVLTWFGELPNKIAYWLGFALGTVVKWGMDMWDYLKVKVPEIIGNVVTYFAGLPAKIKEKLTSAWDKVKEWASNTLDLIKTEVPKIIAKVQAFFAELPAKIKEKLSYAWNRVKDWASDTFVLIKEEVPKIINKITEFFAGVKDKIAEKLALVKAKITGWVSNAVGWVKEEVPKIIDKIVEFFFGLKDKVAEKLLLFKSTIERWVRDSIRWVKTEVPKVITSIVDFFAELPSKIFNKIKEFAGTMKDIGGWILDGIFGGFTNIKNRVIGFKDNFVSGFKKALGIESPSKVMRDEVGKFLGEGIAEGLSRTTGEIVDTATGISDGIQGAFTDVTMSAGVKYRVGDMGSLPSDMNVGVTGHMSNTVALDSGNFNEGIYGAVYNAVTSAMSIDERGDVVLNVDGTTLGRVAIKGINKVTKQEGRVLLQV